MYITKEYVWSKPHYKGVCEPQYIIKWFVCFKPQYIKQKFVQMQGRVHYKGVLCTS